jgi:hypothetical protein
MRVGLFVSGVVLCAYAGMERVYALEEAVENGHRNPQPLDWVQEFVTPITSELPPLVATLLLCKHVLL